MSAPDYLYVNMANGQLVKHLLPNRMSVLLFDYMLPHMADVAPDYAKQFEGEFSCCTFSIADLPEKDFMAVYQLIMDACDDINALQPLKGDLQTALLADPRYKKQTA
ncbi:hypothetical protein PL75_03015 [Neisseria arctica]|uniref:Uncharacterized protein n=1 Tax=Neisseria arctica TaxID=1470200 RepID=A0A0J0YTU3_9NEIS|nr:hypothetical protein [Neisseria arctica]KLT73547.1 hypothetical protein PL75_03015 [Neisseria arctica]UOO86217.1 hypothetical protein LVJ86_08320 [Neisseria arctica]